MGGKREEKVKLAATTPGQKKPLQQPKSTLRPKATVISFTNTAGSQQILTNAQSPPTSKVTMMEEFERREERRDGGGFGIGQVKREGESRSSKIF